MKGFRTVKEIIQEARKERKEFKKRALEGKATWGNWTYDPETLVLTYNGERWYEVDLERCNTSAQILDWLCQVSHKPYITPEQIGYLLLAIDEIVYLQAHVCSMGVDKPFKMKKFLANNKLIKKATPKSDPS